MVENNSKDLKNMSDYIENEKKKEQDFIQSSREGYDWYWNVAPQPEHDVIEWQSYNKSKPENLS